MLNIISGKKGSCISELISRQKGNLIGTEIPGLKIPADGHTFKVRSANTDTKMSQSNGYRIIYYVVRDDEEIYLLTIYYKKDDNKIPTNQEIIKFGRNLLHVKNA